MYLMLEICKGDLLPDILQEIWHTRLEMEIHCIDASQEREKDKNPFYIMDRRIVKFQIFVRHPHPKNGSGSDKSQTGGERSPHPGKARGRFDVGNDRPDEKPKMPNDQ
jgi:hypothetical protein